MLLKKFPYVLYFRPDPAPLIIIAVRHGRENPRVWQRRVSDSGIPFKFNHPIGRSYLIRHKSPNPGAAGVARVHLASTLLTRTVMRLGPWIPCSSGLTDEAKRRRVVRPTLPLLLLFASALPALAQLPADGRTSYARDDRIRIPFELRTGGPATRVVLYYSFDGGAWQEHDSARPGQKREFLFRADRDGPYSFATMTHFSDGTSDPARKDQLTEQRRVVIDKTPPRVLSLRPSLSADGAPGIEWDATDDNMDPKGIKLEFKWPEMSRFETIDRNVPFGPRDSRHWQMKTNDRMQVRIVATDRAGNRTESDAVYVSAKDAEKSGEFVPKRPSANGASNSVEKDVMPAAGTRASQPALHYVNTKSVSLNVNATVGPSGLTRSFLYAADEKLAWAKVKEDGPKAAPPVTAPDKPRLVPLNFVYEAKDDGLFNFIFIVENHRGPSRRVPKTGEASDVQVMVDTTKPVVEILSTRVASNGDRGAVVDIRWKATDANIAPVPIKLEYQAIRNDRPGEPNEWKAITPDWIDNTGQHTWSAPTGEAYEFLIRVTCKDRAGNEAKAESVKPVNTDLALPGVEGVDVVPGRGGVSGVGGGSVPGISGIDIGGSAPSPMKRP